MTNYPPQYNAQSASYNTETVATTVSSAMKQVYLRMTLALIVTAFVSLLCANSIGFLSFLAQNSFAFWFLAIVEIGLVIGISAGINKISSTTATLLFFLFAIVNGMTLAPIFKFYTGVSIAKTFFITAGTFAAMSVYGYCTNRDLSRMGSILFMLLIGIIIASIVNIFMTSNSLDLIISFVGVIIFVGLTAWDTQKIKQMAMESPISVGHLATIGALSLYLDFINMFLYLLRFFGNRD